MSGLIWHAYLHQPPRISPKRYDGTKMEQRAEGPINVADHFRLHIRFPVHEAVTPDTCPVHSIHLPNVTNTRLKNFRHAHPLSCMHTLWCSL